ncbi:restriction endonuclease subunit S [Dyadobacter sp.]|uniref:restriction endonuclease subunit S n=1 Tax=Dyadobacter sp. TaxID=1914288 RepID=UPI003F70D87F
MIEVCIDEIIGKKGVFIDGDWVESKDQDPQGEVRLLQLADIGDGYFINKSNRFLNRETAERLGCTFLAKGDLLVARMPDPIGRACIFPGLPQPCVTVVDVCIIRPDKNIANVEWLKFQINDTSFRTKINQFISGSTRQRISRGNLSKITFKLPSLLDQIKIVTVLNKAETLVKQRKENINLLNEILKSTFLKMFGDPVRNERNWHTLTLSSFCSKIGSGATPRGGKESYHSEGISLIRSLNVHNDVLILDDLAFINEEQAVNLQNVVVKENDVLLNITGASVARCCVVKNEILPARVNQHVAIIRPNEDIVNNVFLARLFTTKTYQNFLLKKARSKGATREALTKEDLESLEIIVPPITLQNQFAIIVEKAEILKAQFQRSLADLENLNDSLSQKAFKGELDLNSLNVVEEEEYFTATNDRTEDWQFNQPKTLNVYKKGENKKHAEKDDVLNWQSLANRIKTRFKDQHFNFEMLINFMRKNKLSESIQYYSSEELKANPRLNEAEDLKTFIYSAVQNVEMDEMQQRQTNPFLKLTQSFYNAEDENFSLTLHKEDFNIIENKEIHMRSGIYFRIAKEA